jgi:hypothetical protein
MPDFREQGHPAHCFFEWSNRCLRLWTSSAGRFGRRCSAFRREISWAAGQGRFLPAPRKRSNVKNPETGACLGCSAYSCKSLQPQISRKSAEIPPTFQRAFLNRECPSSNPAKSARHSLSYRLCALESNKCLPIAGFCEVAIRLYTPNSNNLGAKSPIVSGLLLKYSRFLETGARDRARSALRGVGRSPNQAFLRKRTPQSLTNS